MIKSGIRRKKVTKVEERGRKRKKGNFCVSTHFFKPRFLLRKKITCLPKSQRAIFRGWMK
jgi:hypothetical protein